MYHLINSSIKEGSFVWQKKNHPFKNNVQCAATVHVAAFVWWSSASEQNTWNFAKVNSKEAFVFTGLVAMKLQLDCSSMNIPLLDRYPQNLHWKLGQQTPSVRTLLVYLETMAIILFFFKNKFFLFFKIESWNFSICLKKNFVKPHKISTQSDNG